MAAKTANVMARVEPSVKEQAEEILEIGVADVRNLCGIPQFCNLTNLWHNATVLYTVDIIF